MLAVNSTKRPKVDGDHLTSQVGQAQGLASGVEPGGVFEFGCRPVVFQFNLYHFITNLLRYRLGF